MTTTAQSISDLILTTTGVTVTVYVEPHGYLTLVGTRAEAATVASAVVAAFAADPESGQSYNVAVRPFGEGYEVAVGYVR